MLKRTKGHETQRQRADESAASHKDTIERSIFKGCQQSPGQLPIASPLMGLRCPWWPVVPTASMRVTHGLGL
jgi:hypothetical protein